MGTFSVCQQTGTGLDEAPAPILQGMGRRFRLWIRLQGKSFMRRIAFLSAALVLPALAQQPITPAPASLVREGVTEKLTAHVWVIPDGSASLVPNVGIVVGKKAVLVIDTGM